MAKTKTKVTFKSINNVVNDILIMKDKGAMKLLLASVVANQMDQNQAVWMLFVAPSSSGKTVLLESIIDVEKTIGKPLIYSISDMTQNTLASAYKGEGGGSLLQKMPNKGAMMVFKDFTTLLEKTKDVKAAIMSQLREVYDGSYSKQTGTMSITWRGKVGAIGAVTEMIYDNDNRISAMGDRWVMYSIDQPSRRELGERVFENAFAEKTENEKMKYLQKITKTYIEDINEQLLLEPKHNFSFGEEEKNKLIDIADLASMARSGVITDFKGEKIVFIPAKEQMGRLLHQLIAVARALSYMNKNDGLDFGLTADDFAILTKIAFSSIPKKRRLALEVLTKYKKGVTTKGVGMSIDYPTGTVESWLQELNGLKIIKRVEEYGQNLWRIEPRFAGIVADYAKIEILDEDYSPNLIEDDDLNSFGDSGGGKDW